MHYGPTVTVTAWRSQRWRVYDVTYLLGEADDLVHGLVLADTQLHVAVLAARLTRRDLAALRTRHSQCNKIQYNIDTVSTTQCNTMPSISC